MVQKNSRPPSGGKTEAPAEPKRRGRPRAYQPDIALGKALDLFRKDGFAATSLDDLSAATGMNRPSLYGAFGDKRELYIKSYQRYRDDARAAMAEIFRDELPIRTRLQRIYAVALDIYLGGESPRGCFTVMTAASEAVADPEIRAMALEGFVELDKAFAACFRLAKEKGELPKTADPIVLGASRLGHHPHHRDPRPRPRAAQGIGSDRQRRAGCDAGRQGVNHQHVVPANAPPSRRRQHNPRAVLLRQKSICDNQSHHARENQQCREGFSDHWPRRMARSR